MTTRRFLLGTLAAALFGGIGPLAVADDKDATAVLDKAIAALGGEAKLAKATAATWKAKGTMTFNDNESDVSTVATIDGITRYRSDFEGEFGGNTVKGSMVLDGDKGWRSFGGNVMELDEEAVANEKRTAYLQAVSTFVLPLKGKGFTVEKGGEEKVGDKPAVILKAKGPDGKDFTIYFDKDNGLPVKLVATVRGFGGEDYTQITKYTAYKDFDGVKKATKVEMTRDGNPFLDMTVSDFKVLDKADPKAFAEPK